MDNRYIENVVNEMLPFLEENGFKKLSDTEFENEKKSIKISYDEARQMYALSAADVEEGKAGEFSELSAWLFDDSQNAKDAEAVGIDFTETLRSNMGIKIKRAVTNTGDIDLPSGQAGGAVTVAAFTKKVLDVYPQFKELYKEHIAVYGNFLYMEFFAKTLVPQIKSVLTENNKKTVKKLFELLQNAYINGDKETVNIVVAVVAAAAQNDETVKANAIAMLETDTHFKNSVENFIPMLASKKKLLAALVK